MTGYNYPDNLYAEDRAKQTPTGAYRSTDAVNHPAHYQRAGIETIDYIRASLGDGFGPYCIGNVLKYVSRYREKGGVEDLDKARVYLGWAIDALHKQAADRVAFESQIPDRFELPPNLRDAMLRQSGIGDVMRHTFEIVGGGGAYVPEAGSVAYTTGANDAQRHPMSAEADRLKPGDML